MGNRKGKRNMANLVPGSLKLMVALTSDLKSLKIDSVNKIK